MKSTTLFLIFFTALAAAAPQSAAKFLAKRETSSTGERCGGPSKKKCADGETCVYETQFGDSPMGLCVIEAKYCGGEREPSEGCPKDGKYTCLYDRNIDCWVADAHYCGWCVETKWIDEFGKRGEGLNRCGGDSGKTCYEGTREKCMGEEILKDGMGICIEFDRKCTIGDLESCGTNPRQGPMYCVRDPRVCKADEEDCTKGVCLEGRYVDQVGLKEGVTSFPSSTTIAKPTPTLPTKKPTLSLKPTKVSTLPPKPTKKPTPLPKTTKKPTYTSPPCSKGKKKTTTTTTAKPKPKPYQGY